MVPRCFGTKGGETILEETSDWVEGTPISWLAPSGRVSGRAHGGEREVQDSSSERHMVGGLQQGGRGVDCGSTSARGMEGNSTRCKGDTYAKVLRRAARLPTDGGDLV